MLELEMSADQLVSALLVLAETDSVSILDSCGVGHLGSHLLVAGIAPHSVVEMSGEDPELVFQQLENLFHAGAAVFFSMSYDVGARLHGVETRRPTAEPGLYAASCDCLIIHDYAERRTHVVGNGDKDKVRKTLLSAASRGPAPMPSSARARSNFSREDYLKAVEAVRERIRAGDTYQANLTQQFTVPFASAMSAEDIFARLRKAHPAPFAAFLKRSDSTVISASPERFFKVQGQRITTSPVKGTRERSGDLLQDEKIKAELLSSSKDIAENTMIVDLLRNDLGQICRYGSVEVEKLCDLEEHPTLFHLVSTVSGVLRDGVRSPEVFRALFPCGSITGAPKISTMHIINDLEPSGRGLSMGAIGYYLPDGSFGSPEILETSVAIRTMVIRDRIATFNVGGGIVIDSDPESEYLETLTKAKALFNALGTEFPR